MTVKLIVGLGNIGKKYEHNRHNIGFMVADSYASQIGATWEVSQDFMCYFSKTSELLLCKPTTFMNKSGEAVRAVSSFYKVNPHDILVIHDDLDLPVGKIRVGFGSSSAGNNGVESVIASLATADFGRLRIGIGRPFTKQDPADYVLQDFGADEQKELPKIIATCRSAIDSYLGDGISAMMNKYN